MMMRIAFVALIGLFCGTVPAQEILKHPRVVELEDALKDGASEYVKARFPSIPFMVTVRVDPLRRDLPRKGGSESYTYFDPDAEDEIKDEWDNPQVPLKALINRVRRVTVSLSVPSKLREADVNELKDGIFNVLHLTPARDEIQIARRDWVTEEVPWLIIYAGSAVLIGLLTGLLLINRSSANRIARALGDVKFGGGSGAHAGGPSAPMPAMDIESREDGKGGKELTFNDPIKMKELASRHIQFLVGEAAFPNHRDVFVLDKFGQDSPAKLGAILAEFPAEMQSRLFAYGSGFHWVEALNAPGFLDYSCLEVIQTLTQNPRKGDNVNWGHAVLAVWRLEDKRTQFVKSLPKEEAFALLAEMPKAIGVHEARRAFPGSWAAILDPGFKAQRVASARIKEIEEGATRIHPLNQIEMVQRYRMEQELLEYLKTVDPAEESDIYGALAEESMVHKLRPPFYPLFEQPAEVLQWLVPGISIEQWALALFNLPKSERAKIDAHLSDKQKFLMVERFKKFDQSPPDRGLLNAAREQIGAALRRYFAERATADSVNHDIDALNLAGNTEQNDPKAA